MKTISISEKIQGHEEFFLKKKSSGKARQRKQCNINPERKSKQVSCIQAKYQMTRIKFKKS